MNTKEQTPRQRNSLIHTLLLQQKGQIFDGITAMRFVSSTYGISEDWHVYADYLDYLARIDAAQQVGINSDGHNQYMIK